eukprot:1645154-Pleurochrysis_carterae.AAC.1
MRPFARSLWRTHAACPFAPSARTRAPSPLRALVMRSRAVRALLQVHVDPLFAATWDEVRHAARRRPLSPTLWHGRVLPAFDRTSALTRRRLQANRFQTRPEPNSWPEALPTPLKAAPSLGLLQSCPTRPRASPLCRRSTSESLLDAFAPFLSHRVAAPLLRSTSVLENKPFATRLTSTPHILLLCLFLQRRQTLLLPRTSIPSVVSFHS